MSVYRPDITNAQLTDAEFDELRAGAYAESPETPLVDFDEAVAFAHRHMRERNLPRALEQAQAEGRTLVQPRAGVGDFEGERMTLRVLEEAGADVMPVTVDSFTRMRRYEDAARGARESTPTHSKLNGYPVVHYGVERTRQIVLERKSPFHLRANSTDLRLIAEVGFAAGMSGFVSGPLYSTVQYSKDVSLATSIRNWQFCYRLMGKYTEAGVPMVDDALGFTQSGVFSIPSLMHAGVVLEALIMAGQGVKHVLAYAISQSTLSQDVAAVLAVRELTEEYLRRFGYDDVQVYVAANCWAGPYPANESAAYGLTSIGTTVAALGGAELLYVKSIEEGFGVPTAEGNAATVRASRYVLHQLAGQDFARTSPEVQFERELNLLEGRAILDAALHLGDGDPVQAAIRGCEAGVLDYPVAPSNVVKGKVLAVRDARGAARFLDYGDVPIPAEARDMEKERLDERRVRKGSPLGYQDVVADLDHMVWKGEI